MLLGSGTAQAACTPASANNVTATCTGTTVNQGGGAPGTSAAITGYGTGSETGITVNVAASASISASGDAQSAGINIKQGTVNVGTGATVNATGILGAGVKLYDQGSVVNSGSITSAGYNGIDVGTPTFIGGNFVVLGGPLTVVNNAGGSITGTTGIGTLSTTSVGTVTNNGTITGTVGNGIGWSGSIAVTNNVGASITASNGTGIGAAGGSVVNAGTITGGSGIDLGSSSTGTVTNSGNITGTSGGGISAGVLTVTNAVGGTVTGATNGITGGTSLNVTNSGTIVGSDALGSGVGASGIVNVINNAGASITGGVAGIEAVNSTAIVTNSGSIAAVGHSVAGGYGIAAGTVILVNNAGSTISGSSFGILATAGGSSVYNAGTIIGVGGTAISFAGTGNTLTIAPGSVISGGVGGTGSDTFQLGGSGAATFDVSQLDGGQYGGFGTFNKIGSSTWTLTGTAVYSGPINVNAGTLDVEGRVGSASLLTVNDGGILTGTGRVGTTSVMSGGILAPGSGVAGTSLTVGKSLAFQSGAIYLVQVSPTAASFTNVGGSATLGGATVDAVLAPGSYVAKTYTILTAAGGVSGTFAPGVVTNSPILQGALSYDANNAYLNLVLNYNALGGLNGNQRAVGDALARAFNSGAGIPLSYASLSPSGLTQASGELGASSQQVTFGAMSQFMGLLTDPFMQRSGGASAPGGAPGYADEGDQRIAYAARRSSDALAMFTKAPPVPYVQRWNVWAAGFGGSQSTDGNAAIGSNNASSSIYGTAVGADYMFSPNTLAGFALSGGGTSFNVAGLGTGRSDLFQAGVYVRHTEGPAYVTAALAYGWQDITTDRIVTIAGVDHLRAEFNANAWSGRLEGGYRFVSPWSGGIGLTPYAAAQFTTFDLPAYAESVVSGSGAFALAYVAKSVTDTRTEFGLRADKSFAMQDSVLTLRGRLAWAHDFDPNRAVAATFQALPGASFVVNGAAQASDSALTTASAEIKWMNGWSAAATFEGEFSDVTRSYAGKGVVRYAW